MYEIWSWIYGFDEQTLSGILTKQSSRNDYIEADINKYFSIDEKGQKITVKEEYKKIFNEKLSKCPSLIGGVECLKKRWKYKLYY